jgi:hypothetical protein
MIAHFAMLSFAVLSQADAAKVNDDHRSLLEAFLKDAQTYEINAGGKSQSNLTLLPRSILNWGSPERTGENGSVFVWMNNGRPELIGAIWSLYRPTSKETVWRHGLQSLSQDPITAHFDSKLIWAPKQPGLAFQLAEGADTPAENPPRRIVEMRNLAREFRVEIDEQSGVTSQLRLLTQPLLRYEPTEGSIRDGAIFAFNAGTDPDALLVIEARESENGLRWQYAFGRLHFVAMRAFRDGKQVWNVDRDLENRRHRFGADPGRDKIYYSVVRPH